jgi:hypothetical protein
MRMKIVGVVNNYKEALEIEEIVKVFIIKQRIFNLLSNEKNKNLEDINSNVMIFSPNEIKNIELSDEKNLHAKINEGLAPVFNVRGLI